jgi:hypothetical protein
MLLMKITRLSSRLLLPVAVLCALLLTYVTCDARPVVNVVDAGAVGDGRTLNTPAFQRAVTMCASTNGCTLLVPVRTVSLSLSLDTLLGM